MEEHDHVAILISAVDGSRGVGLVGDGFARATGETVAVSNHGGPFAAVVQRGHVAGVQFHPEKSGEVGLRVLRNFVDMTPRHTNM